MRSWFPQNIYTFNVCISCVIVFSLFVSGERWKNCKGLYAFVKYGQRSWGKSFCLFLELSHTGSSLSCSRCSSVASRSKEAKSILKINYCVWVKGCTNSLHFSSLKWVSKCFGFWQAVSGCLLVWSLDQSSTNLKLDWASGGTACAQPGLVLAIAKPRVTTVCRLYRCICS